eukprot:UN24853
MKNPPPSLKRPRVFDFSCNYVSPKNHSFWIKILINDTTFFWKSDQLYNIFPKDFEDIGQFI